MARWSSSKGIMKLNEECSPLLNFDVSVVINHIAFASTSQCSQMNLSPC